LEKAAAGRDGAGHSGVMTGAHLHGVGTLPGPAPALEPDDSMFACHGAANPDPRDPQLADETSAVECASTYLLTW
jgi:hypothetical protein